MDPAARIHPAEPSPPYCAACHQAKPQEQHVDFGAATDGPMLAPLEGAVGVVGHSIDDIIICATCVEEAARLIGLEDTRKLREQLEAERVINTRLHAQVEHQRSGVTDALQTALKRARGDEEAPAPTTVNSSLPIRPEAPARTSKRRPRQRGK